MNLDTKISGKFMVKDWIRDSVELTINAPNIVWEKAFEDYFELRLQTRYFDPVSNLAEDSSNEGKGFSIVAIQCSLIEFFESTYNGRSYRLRGGPPVDTTTEYTSSSEVFTTFLVRVFPSAFKDKLGRNGVNSLADEFYDSVRCGVMHEARTKEPWVIRIDMTAKTERTTGPMIAIEANESILYWNNFQDKLEDYVQSYKTDLLGSRDLKEKFKRKLQKLFCG